MATTCVHPAYVRAVTPSTSGCEEAWPPAGTTGSTCGCACTAATSAAATAPGRRRFHFHTTDHPIVRSLEPGEHWLWCYADEVIIEMEAVPPAGGHL